MELPSQNKTARSAAIDIAKGIGILLVFLGHISLTPKIMKIWLQSFHMPLFFICSGLVFSTKKYSHFKQYFITQIKTLLVPYFSLGICLFLLICFNDFLSASLTGNDVVFTWNIKNVLISLFLGYRRHKWYFSLWFISTLFISKLLFFFEVKALNNHKIGFLVLSIVFTYIQWIVFKLSSGFYWSLDLVPACLAFLSFGYYIRMIPIQRKLFSPKLFPLICLLSIFLAILNYKVEGRAAGLYSCYMGNPVLYYLGAVTGTWMVLIFSNWINNHTLLEFLGKNSLVLYAFNNDFSIPFSALIVQSLAEKHDMMQDKTAQWILILSCSIAIGSLLSIAINRYLPWLIGRRRISANHNT